MPRRKLSRKPSRLIAQALDDLAEIERDPRYVIEMENYFHRPFGDGCVVCFAGAVMAKSLGASSDLEYQTSHFPDERIRLLALDQFRSGAIADGLDYINLGRGKVAERKRRALPFSMKVPPYSENRLGFKLAMRRMIRMFEAVGL